ncbi:hypothetical protein GH714_023602 [Hevea brasiliensis]|uniref:Sugar phosphate transporter domain-containing protein n=1 Tax=Hevea brasiliensis TaxID=3981 RepID=A0A6A6LU86_HEVBR|nr:hypothetical protein GH714_023602 [Hevea brasiliensis]
MKSVRGVNVPMYTSLRRTTVAFTMIMEYFLAGQRYTPPIVGSVGVIILGAFIAGARDLSFDFYGYAVVFLANITTAIYLATISRIGKSSGLNSFGLMWCNGILCGPVLLFWAFIRGELVMTMNFPYLFSPGFLAVLLLSCILAFFLNYSIFLNTTLNSALTQTICGNLKDLFTIGLGWIIFGGLPFDVLNVIGQFLGFLGSGLYAYYKLIGRTTTLGANPTLAQMKKHEEDVTKKPKALTCLHLALSDVIFTRIMACETPKEAWDKLKAEFEGSERVKTVKLLTLKREFEMLRMKDGETVKEYSFKLLDTVNKIRLLGEDFGYQKVVEKMLISLPAKFEAKIYAITWSNAFGAAKHVLRYIRGTTDCGIWYTSVEDEKLIGYSDSDWARCPDDMKSIARYVFSMGSGDFSWMSRKQDLVAQLTADAEYVALAAAANQAIWLRKILSDLHQIQKDAIIVYVDNQSAISMAKNPVYHGRTKHINVKFHAIRHAEKEGDVQLVHCRSEEQIADIMTKTLSRGKFIFLRAALGVLEKNLKEENVNS